MEKLHHRYTRKNAVFKVIAVLMVIAIIAVIALVAHNQTVRRVLDSADAYNKRGLDFYTQGDLDNANENYEKATTQSQFSRSL